MRFGPLVALLATACASTQSAHRPDGPIAHAAWFEGSVEQAFTAAQQQHKPIFLYWGAAWCPPCNQIKAEVFSTPEFAELMKTVVPVYLDGDSERAQLWGEKLRVSGYPTLLMLRADGTELMRMGEFVELSEFTTAFKSALAANRPTSEIVAQALAGKATQDEWNILAYASWDEATGVELATRLKLFLAAPASLIVEQSVIAAKLLESASVTPPDSAEAKEIRAHRKELLDAMFPPFDAAVVAARSTIVGMSQEIIVWLFPDAADPERKVAIEKWVRAADFVGSDPKVSVSTRLLSVVPSFHLWRLQHPKQPLPKEVVQDVEDAVDHAVVSATTPYLHHAVISDAAEILVDVGDSQRARALLLRELKNTDTPWYYQASLARLEMKAANEAAALEWSGKARETAQGNATRLQWIALDLALNAQSKQPDRDQRVAKLLREFYEVAFALPDGFSGRNAVRAGSFGKALGDWRKSPPISTVVHKSRELCLDRARQVYPDACDLWIGGCISRAPSLRKDFLPCEVHFQRLYRSLMAQ
jgi:protein disulfide-isomerase